MKQLKKAMPYFLLLLIWSCADNKKEEKTNSASQTEMSKNHVFPKGEKGPSSTFTGTVWHTPLVANDTVYNSIAGQVLFEAGARTHWHSHPAGQILLVLEGVGYHQIAGEPIEIIKKGDVVKCPPHVNHWHGASKDKTMAHLYWVPNTEKGIVNWGAAVTDEEYTK